MTGYSAIINFVVSAGSNFWKKEDGKLFEVEMSGMDALEREEIYTIDDIYALPDGMRAELLDGKMYYMATPNRTHQKISMFLSRTIGNYIELEGGECEVYAAPFAVFLNNDNVNYVEPDISVICDQSKLDEKGCHGAPDWIIEIVSPGSKSMDYLKKLFKYQMSGVREYWIVDPTIERIMVYWFDKEMIEQYSFGDNVPVGIYEGFIIKIG